MAGVGDVASLRASIHSLVDQATPEALRACETVLIQYSEEASGGARVEARVEGARTRRPRARAGRRNSRRPQASDEEEAGSDEPSAGISEESVRDDAAEQTLQIVTYDTKFVQHVSQSTLIGDRYEKVEVSGQAVVDGIQAEFQQYLEEVHRLKVANREEEAKQLMKFGRKFHLNSQCVDALTGENSNPKIGVVKVYSAESGVYPTVNATMRNHDASKVGLTAFVRLLNDTLTHPMKPLFSWAGPCYRWMKLPEQVVQQYEPNVYELNNYISCAGFTSASRDSGAAWWNRTTFAESNMLLVFEQEGGGPTDISRVSEFAWEAEVLYSLGQTFRKEKKIYANFEELCAIMGRPPADEDWPLESFDLGPVHVVFLTAVDVFHELAEDLNRGGGTADEALPLLEKRRQYEINCGRDAKLGEAQALLTLGKASCLAAKYDDAIDFITRSMNIRRTIYGDEQHPDMAECIFEEAKILIAKADYTRALDLLGQSLTMRRQRLGERDSKVADSLTEIGWVLFKMGEYDRALENLNNAMPMYLEAKGERHPKVAHVKKIIGLALWKKNDYVGALASYEVAIAINRESLGPEHPDVAKVLNNMAIVYEQQQNYASAIFTYEECLNLHRKAHGDRHPLVADTLMGMGRCFRLQGDCARALASFQEALGILRETLGPKHPQVGDTLQSMGVAYQNNGQWDKAKDAYLQAAEVFKDHYGEEHARTKDMRQRAANCHA